jgi:hypothetical protein
MILLLQITLPRQLTRFTFAVPNGNTRVEMLSAQPSSSKFGGDANKNVVIRWSRIHSFRRSCLFQFDHEVALTISSGLQLNNVL